MITSTEATASGQGGEIRIATGALRILDGAVLSARTRNAANGGNIFVNVNTLEALNGGQILTTAFSSGSAGDITVDATNSVTLSGSDPTFSNRLAQFGPEIVDPDDPASGLFARTQDAGIAGDLTITTGQLQVRDGAQVTVSGEGSGNAGNLEVEADSIRLSNRANISANTRAGQGNINLRSGDLVLRRESNITTNATGTASGGNITIDTDVLAALENSDIGANAQGARGGRVRIDAQGIFGTGFRNQPTPLSDITASSNLGFEFSGTVEINTPDVDPSQGLVNLPTVPIDTEVVQACTPGGSQQQSEFVITGRGGLPPNPGDALSTDAVIVDLVTLNPESNRSSAEEGATNSIKQSAPTQIVEANGWEINNKGEVVLTAAASTTSLDIPWVRSSKCNAPEPEP